MTPAWKAATGLLLIAGAALGVILGISLDGASGGSGAFQCDVTIGCATPTPRPSPSATHTPTATPTTAPTATPTATPSPTPTPKPSGVMGLMMPIEGALLPTSARLMPNAPRDYRYGAHEGVDFYTGYVGVPISYGTPVLAAAPGTVTVATHDYQNLTPERWKGILERCEANGDTLPDDLFVLRGRQVEIDHGEGISTRYAHLSEIAPSVMVGGRVEAGQVIGYVGNSGIIDAYYDPEAEVHLHFEIRVGGSYLGGELTATEVRALYEQAFSLRQEETSTGTFVAGTPFSS